MHGLTRSVGLWLVALFGEIDGVVERLLKERGLEEKFRIVGFLEKRKLPYKTVDVAVRESWNAYMTAFR